MVKQEVKVKTKVVQSIMIMTRNALKKGVDAVASLVVVDDNADDHHPSDSDANIVVDKTGTTVTKMFRRAPPTGKPLNTTSAMMEIMTRTCPSRPKRWTRCPWTKPSTGLLRQNNFPTSLLLVVNKPASSTSSKTEDTSARMGVSSDTTFNKVMAEANVDSLAEMDHINPLVVEERDRQQLVQQAFYQWQILGVSMQGTLQLSG